MLFNLNIDFKRTDKELEADKQSPNREVAAGYINFAIQSSHPQGIDGQMRRIVNRIQRKLDEALDNEVDEIELEKAEIDLIKRSFDKAIVPVSITKFFCIMEDVVQSLE